MKAAQRDVCYYCGQQYHPQLICTLGSGISGVDKPATIWVCEYDFKFDDQGEFQGLDARKECKEKAELDGYKQRRDLTPTR
jgi:hypothetical protein